jgi:hypothetical protein
VRGFGIGIFGCGSRKLARLYDRYGGFCVVRRWALLVNLDVCSCIPNMKGVGFHGVFVFVSSAEIATE